MWCVRLKAPYCGVDWHEGIQELGLLTEKGQIGVNISNIKGDRTWSVWAS
jgi:hypothetical protein